MAEYNWTSKIQAYLAKIAGKEVTTLPEPSDKIQGLLKDIADNGGAGGGLPSASVEDAGKTIITDGTDASWSNRGYSYSESYSTIYDDSVTTVDTYDDGYGSADLTDAATTEPPETIKITIGDTLYVLDIDSDGYGYYGAPFDYDIGQYDWSTYAFAVNWNWNQYSGTATVTLYTKDVGTYAVKLEAKGTSISLSTPFVSALPKAVVLIDGTSGSIGEYNDLREYMMNAVPVLVCESGSLMTGSIYKYFYYAGYNIQNSTLMGYYFSNGLAHKYVTYATGEITDYTPGQS